MKVVGVVSGFIPEVVPSMNEHNIASPANAGTVAKSEPWRIRQRKNRTYFEYVDNGSFVALNTGIVQGYMIAPAIDLIREHPIGPEVKGLPGNNPAANPLASPLEGRSVTGLASSDCYPPNEVFINMARYPDAAIAPLVHGLGAARSACLACGGVVGGSAVCDFRMGANAKGQNNFLASSMAFCKRMVTPRTKMISAGRNWSMPAVLRMREESM